MYGKVYDNVLLYKDELIKMSDYIFDNPELGMEEFKASKVITDFLIKNGFEVEMGICGMETAFKAVYKNNGGGANIGFLCEYDALEGLGHACGHHMQSPCILGAVMAVINTVKDKSYTITIYGTPAEETVSGKLIMIKNGMDFTDLDVAFMMHGGPSTQVDVKSLAMSKITAHFRGKSAHAAVKPENGRSALDSLILAFQGVEFLREHVPDDVRMHYTIVNNLGPVNVIPAYAVGEFSIRSYSATRLYSVVDRVKKVLQGAALMTETELEIEMGKTLDNKIPSITINDIVMKHAKNVNAPALQPPREKTGSTDFGSVLHRVPGTCIRVAFVSEDASSHSQEFLDRGKSKEAHEAIIYGSKILAGAAVDLINDESILIKAKEEFAERMALEEKEK